MLPSPNRMTRAADFGAVVRSGRRARSGTLVVHHQQGVTPTDAAPVVGFVVSRSVGISVVRHRVTRRLRERVRPLLVDLPAGSATVVRALPAAATASSSQLGRDLDQAFARLTVRSTA